jgi:hypothetical protein
VYERESKGVFVWGEFNDGGRVFWGVFMGCFKNKLKIEKKFIHCCHLYELKGTKISHFVSFFERYKFEARTICGQRQIMSIYFLFRHLLGPQRVARLQPSNQKAKSRNKELNNQKKQIRKCYSKMYWTKFQ